MFIARGATWHEVETVALDTRIFSCVTGHKSWGACCIERRVDVPGTAGPVGRDRQPATVVGLAVDDRGTIFEFTALIVGERECRQVCDRQRLVATQAEGIAASPAAIL